MITVQREAQHIPGERTDCSWDLRTRSVLSISVNQVNSACLTAPQYTLQRCAAVYIYIYIYMCRGRWGTVHRCTSTIAVFSHFSNRLAVTHSAKSHDALLSDRTCFVSASFRSRSATPAAAWTNAPPPRHQLANMWSPCIRTTGWRYCSARTMCSYNR